ncbi:MAG: polyprenyl synthetase family protein, partial [Flavobacteriaceae bacterium]|nr:polyprenyl synthetase family protein [Flavobacteriaceae bacterium]
YLQMISYKTVVLLGCSLAMGAIVAGAKDTQVQHCYDIGVSIGEAFQLRDDYLDAFGNQEHFGKSIGGDIWANKKTILYVLALKNADEKGKAKLLKLFSNTDKTQDKVEQVTAVYHQFKVPEAVKAMIEDKTTLALGLVGELSIDVQYKEVFHTFIKTLMQREV